MIEEKILTLEKELSTATRELKMQYLHSEI